MDVLSIYVGEMGVSFWENVVIDFDGARYITEEDFGISYNRSMDIETFHDIMTGHGYRSMFGKYTIVEDDELINLLVDEFKD